MTALLCMVALGMWAHKTVSTEAGLRAAAKTSGAVSYVERSWDDTNKQVVSTEKSLTGSVIGYEDTPAEGQYKEVTTDNGSWFGMGGYSSGPEYYVVRGSLTLETIVVQGKDVHLILCNDAYLRLTGGLKLEGDNKLSIHCQSYGDSMGKLKVTNSYSNAAGIGSAQHNGQEMKVGQLVIHGGHIEAKGGTYGAGIGSCARIEGNTGRLCSRVDIYGGYVEAAGGEHGAGIGGGSGYDYNGVNGGDFYLYDGTVVARGGCYGAGVGGGGSYNSDIPFPHSRCNGGWGGKIVIHGGTLTADGGENAAGIGSGNIYDADACISNTGGTITINGGTVIATGGDNGAGIGGGYNAGGPELTITGGTVTAKGRVDAAGIGGGYDGYGGVIKISGGTVTALGGEGGAGIGGGNGGGTRGGRGGNVTITGGTVIAKAGEQGGEGNRAIGPGQEARTGYWENPENIYGTLTISNKMMVGAGNNGSVERIVNYDERKNACWYRSYAEISPCTHSGTFFTSSSGNTPNDTHATHCQHCTTYYPGEKHTFVDGQCTVCGQETSFDWTHLRLLPAPGSYTVTAGYDNNMGATFEGYKYLFDGIYTEENYDKGFSYPKWCVKTFNSGAATFGNKPCYVEFNTAEPVIPKIYALVTGNDSYQFIGRNPQTWNLKAKLNKNDGWTTIASITEDRVLQDVDCIAYAFGINNNANNAYKYFRFEIFANRGADTMQLTELQLWVEDGVTLVDNIDNTGVIGNHNGQTTDVTLAGRTLYKDGDWNTLCLPFSLASLEGTPLANATIKALESTTFNGDNGTLNLNFSANSLTAIEAGKPYIVKWANADDNIVSPAFLGVTIDNSNTARQRMTTTCDDVAFVGSYKPVNIYTSEKTNLYLGAGNTLCYPWADNMTSFKINACRGYFKLLNGITAGDPSTSRIVLNFGEETTDIIQNTNDTNDTNQNVWYTLDGRRLSGKPAKKGVYINNGIKVVIK